jgi:integrase
MATRKIRGWWHVDLRWNGLRYRMRSPLNTRMGAEQYEIQLRQELLTKGSLDQFGGRNTEKPLTFGEFAERWMLEYVAVNNKPSEQKAKRGQLRRHILPRFGQFTLNEISNGEVERFKAELLGKKLCAKSINNALTILRKCLVTASEWGLLEDVPRIRPLRTARPTYRYLQPDEEALLLGAAKQNRFWYAAVLLALRTGVRFSELSALAWQDIDPSRCDITVRRANVRGHMGPTKTYTVRRVPLSTDAREALGGLVKNGEFVFGYGGKPLSYHTAYEWLVRLCKRAGVDPCGWHDLRHTFASRLVARGAPLRAIQELLGHGSLDMTLRYAHVGQAELVAAVALLETNPSGWAQGGHNPSNGAKTGEKEPAFTTAFSRWN